MSPLLLLAAGAAGLYVIGGNSPVKKPKKPTPKPKPKPKPTAKAPPKPVPIGNVGVLVPGTHAPIAFSPGLAGTGPQPSWVPFLPPETNAFGQQVGGLAGIFQAINTPTPSITPPSTPVSVHPAPSSYRPDGYGVAGKLTTVTRNSKVASFKGSSINLF